MSETHDLEGLTPARLRAVVAVASTGSFTAAARHVGTSQSQISRAVAAVESILGVAIFDRSARSVRITAVGREIVERAALVTAELEAVVRSTRVEVSTPPRMVVASLASVSELYLAEALRGTRPAARRLRCIEGLQATVEQAVISGQATAGIGDLADVAPELATRPLWTEPFCLVVPQGHRLARRHRVTLDDISSESLVGFSREAELRTTLDRELASARQLRTPDYIVDRYRTALSLVAGGFGLMVVPAIVAVAIPAGAKVVELAHSELVRTMGVLHPRDSEVPSALQEFLETLVAAVSRVDRVIAAGS